MIKRIKLIEIVEKQERDSLIKIVEGEKRLVLCLKAVRKMREDLIKTDLNSGNRGKLLHLWMVIQ